MKEYTLSQDLQGTAYLLEYTQAPYSWVRQWHPDMPSFEQWAQANPQQVSNRMLKMVWVTEEKKFDGVSAALNYLIQESWEKEKKSFRFRDEEPKDDRKRLSAIDQDLVNRIQAAYILLERVHQTVHNF